MAETAAMADVDTCGGQSSAGTPAQTWGDDFCLDFTTSKEALKSDAWLLPPNGEKPGRFPPRLPTTCQEGGRVAQGAAPSSQQIQ